MLIEITQTNKELLPDIRKWGCLFLCFAYASPEEFRGRTGVMRLNQLWHVAQWFGYISGDLNGDGDCDDDGEAEVRDYNGLAGLFSLDAKYDNKHHSPDEVPGKDVRYIFGCWKDKGTHFTNLSYGRKKGYTITNDPMGSSATVRNGVLISTRWLYGTKKA